MQKYAVNLLNLINYYLIFGICLGALSSWFVSETLSGCRSVCGSREHDQRTCNRQLDGKFHWETHQEPTALKPTVDFIVSKLIEGYSVITFPEGNEKPFLAATKQLYKWYFPSVCPSVRLSVCPSVRPSVTPFWLCSHHRIIMKFSGVITNDESKVHAKVQGQRSKVKVTEVTTQLNRFRTVTPVWIHIWWWNAAYSLMLLRRGALLFCKVIRQISRSHSSKNRRIWPRLGVSGL